MNDRQRCPHCGGERYPDATYCAWCGVALTSEPALAASTGSYLVAASHPAPSAAIGSESRIWAVGAHVSAIAGGFMGGLPAFLGPLVVWLIRRDNDPYSAAHGRDALNFNLSMLLYGGALIVFSIMTLGLGAFVTIPIGIALGVVWVILSIIGALKAANDEPSHYPMTINFVK